MTKPERLKKEEEHLNKILKGLEIAYERLIEFKRQKNSVLVVMKNNRIIEIKP